VLEDLSYSSTHSSTQGAHGHKVSEGLVPTMAAAAEETPIQNDHDELLKAQTTPLLLKLLSARGITTEEVEGIFLTGSRLWGTASAHSDFDFIVLHTSTNAQLQGKVGVGINTGIDFSLIHVHELERRLDAADMSCVMLQYLPERCVWQRPRKVAITRAVDVAALRDAVISETERDFARAEKMVAHGEWGKAKKTWTHGIRLLMLAVRIAETGRLNGGGGNGDVGEVESGGLRGGRGGSERALDAPIHPSDGGSDDLGSDFHCANGVRLKLLGLHCRDIERYNEVTGPLTRDLKRRLDQAAAGARGRGAAGVGRGGIRKRH